MGEVSIIGLDLAKNVFQVHGADASGAILFRKKVRRARLLELFAAQPSCTVAMEACAGAHYWGRKIGELGRTVRHDRRHLSRRLCRCLSGLGAGDVRPPDGLIAASPARLQSKPRQLT
jgi:hypothetical protein